MRKKWWILGIAFLLGITACGKDTTAEQNNNAVIEETEPTGIQEEPEKYPGRPKVDPSQITYADSYSFDKLTYAGLEEAEFTCLLEAEDAEAGEGIYVKTDKTGYSGAGYLDVTNNTTFSMRVTIPASQYYKITVRHCAGSHKENPLLFNGMKALDIVSEQGDWAETTVDGVFLEKGENIITLGAGWSWFSLDSIAIEKGEPLSNNLYENITTTLNNPYANLKTQNIYQYLLAVYGKRVLTGQCTDYGKNTETEALYLGLGKYPAVRTFDFIYDSKSFTKTGFKDEVGLAIKWSQAGGLVVYDWHWYAPYNECAFYTADTTFSLAKAVTTEELAMLPLEEVEKLQTEGKISIEAYKIVEDIDNISTMMQRMERENVTVLWRPMHEASGGWFWWGASGPDAYKWLWTLMYERMTNYHQLENLIWVWNGQHADWYPGDSYCDIVALDVYNNAHDYGSSPSKFAELSGWAKNSKLTAMSECATMPDPDLIIRDNAYWLWFAVWNWDYIVVNGTKTLSEAYTSLQMMEKVYNSDVMLTRDELPDFSKYDAVKSE